MTRLYECSYCHKLAVSYIQVNHTARAVCIEHLELIKKKHSLLKLNKLMKQGGKH
jgi:hypothetical protein